VRLRSETRCARRCCCTGPVYPYDYNRLNSWDGSYQQANISAYYNAQKHAHCYPGNSKQGSAGWFQWNIRDHSGALAMGAPGTMPHRMVTYQASAPFLHEHCCAATVARVVVPLRLCNVSVCTAAMASGASRCCSQRCACIATNPTTVC